MQALGELIQAYAIALVEPEPRTCWACRDGGIVEIGGDWRIYCRRDAQLLTVEQEDAGCERWEARRA